MTPPQRIAASTPLASCPEGKLGIALPLPVSDRLDALVALVEAAGDRTTRKELLASLIFAAGPSAEQLSENLRRYRIAPASAARLDGRTDDQTVPLVKRRRGPRPRRH